MSLERGDIVWVDFDPAFGHEQAGRRPALVISDTGYNALSTMVLVCPITSNRKPWPFNLPLAPGARIGGAVIVDQLKTIDKRRIHSPRVDRADPDSIAAVQQMLHGLIGADGVGQGD